MLEDLSDFRLLTAEERVSNILDRAQYFGWSGPRVKGLVFCSRKSAPNFRGSSMNAAS